MSIIFKLATFRFSKFLRTFKKGRFWKPDFASNVRLDDLLDGVSSKVCKFNIHKCVSLTQTTETHNRRTESRNSVAVRTYLHSNFCKT